MTDTSVPAASDAAEEAPATMRLGAFELAFAIATMEFATDEYERAISDDEPTIEVPAPRIPPGVPSPLGDDSSDSSSCAPCDADLTSVMSFETLPFCDLDLDLDLEGAFPTC